MNWPEAFVIVTCVWAPVVAYFARGLHRLADIDKGGILNDLLREVKRLNANREAVEKSRAA